MPSPFTLANAHSDVPVASFKVISEYKLPGPVSPCSMHVYQSPMHAPMLLLPGTGKIRAISLRDFKPRRPRPYPESNKDSEMRQLSRAAEKLNIDDAKEQTLDWKEINVADDRELFGCLMSENGALVIGVGAKESVWVWRIPSK